jgi:hypothetical protein
VQESVGSNIDLLNRYYQLTRVSAGCQSLKLTFLSFRVRGDEQFQTIGHEASAGSHFV